MAVMDVRKVDKQGCCYICQIHHFIKIMKNQTE